jgi:putative MATE family efflux protein
MGFARSFGHTPIDPIHTFATHTFSIVTCFTRRSKFDISLVLAAPSRSRVGRARTPSAIMLLVLAWAGATSFASSYPTLSKAAVIRPCAVCPRLETFRTVHQPAMNEATLPCSPEEDTCPVEAESVSTGELVRFLIPTLTSLLSSEAMSVVDTAVVGRASAAELAALGPATMLSDSTAYIFFWLNVATTSLFASRLSTSGADSAFDVLSDALWVALGCGLGLAIALHLFGPAALAGICGSAASESLPAATKYLGIRLLGTPAFMVTTVLQAACLGTRDSVSPLFVLLASGSLNLVLDLYLVISRGMGIGGAAIATLAAQVVQMLMLAGVVQRKRGKLGASGGPLLLRGRPTLSRIGSFLTFAGPIFLVLLGKVSCYNAMTLAATTLGVISLASHQVLVSIFFLACKFGDAVSQTAQAYLPACLAPSAEASGPSGTTAVAQKLSSTLFSLSTVLGVTVASIAYVVATRLPTLFTTDAAVIAKIARVSPLIGAALLIHPACMCAEGLLLGARELPFLARVYAGNIAVFLTALYVISQRALGLSAVWMGLFAFQLVRLVQFGLRGLSVGLVRGPRAKRS